MWNNCPTVSVVHLNLRVQHRDLIPSSIWCSFNKTLLQKLFHTADRVKVPLCPNVKIIIIDERNHGQSASAIAACTRAPFVISIQNDMLAEFACHAHHHHFVFTMWWVSSRRWLPWIWLQGVFSISRLLSLFSLLFLSASFPLYLVFSNLSKQ